MLQLASSLQPPTRRQDFRNTTQLANARRNTQAESIIDTNKRWLSNPDKDWLNSSNITQLQHLDPPLSTLLWRTHRWPLFTILTSTTFAPTDTKKYSGFQYLTKKRRLPLWEGKMKSQLNWFCFLVFLAKAIASGLHSVPCLFQLPWILDAEDITILPLLDD